MKINNPFLTKSNKDNKQNTPKNIQEWDIHLSKYLTEKNFFSYFCFLNKNKIEDSKVHDTLALKYFNFISNSESPRICCILKTLKLFLLEEKAYKFLIENNKNTEITRNILRSILFKLPVDKHKEQVFKYYKILNEKEISDINPKDKNLPGYLKIYIEEFLRMKELSKAAYSKNNDTTDNYEDDYKNKQANDVDEIEIKGDKFYGKRNESNKRDDCADQISLKKDILNNNKLSESNKPDNRTEKCSVFVTDEKSRKVKDCGLDDNTREILSIFYSSKFSIKEKNSVDLKVRKIYSKGRERYLKRVIINDCTYELTFDSYMKNIKNLSLKCIEGELNTFLLCYYFLVCRNYKELEKRLRFCKEIEQHKIKKGMKRDELFPESMAGCGLNMNELVDVKENCNILGKKDTEETIGPKHHIVLDSKKYFKRYKRHFKEALNLFNINEGNLILLNYFREKEKNISKYLRVIEKYKIILEEDDLCRLENVRGFWTKVFSSRWYKEFYREELNFKNIFERVMKNKKILGKVIKGIYKCIGKKKELLKDVIVEYEKLRNLGVKKKERAYWEILELLNDRLLKTVNREQERYKDLEDIFCNLVLSFLISLKRRKVLCFISQEININRILVQEKIFSYSLVQEPHLLLDLVSRLKGNNKNRVLKRCPKNIQFLSKSWNIYEILERNVERRWIYEKILNKCIFLKNKKKPTNLIAEKHLHQILKFIQFEIKHKQFKRVREIIKMGLEIFENNEAIWNTYEKFEVEYGNENTYMEYVGIREQYKK